MTLWFVLGLMTLAAAFAVLWPLGRAPVAASDAGEAAIYRDQLAEIERDTTIGLIGAREAEAARIEVSRRLLATATTERQGTATRLGLRRAIALVALIGLPVLSGGLYLRYGSPDEPDQPLASRSQAPAANASLDTLVQQVERHLEQTPQDGRGWEVLAPVLFKLGRYEDAVRAYRNALTYNGETAARHANLGEALGAEAGGVMTAEAKTEFERARALDSSDVKARYFLGVAAQQDGRSDEAAAIWQQLIDSSPSDAPWRAAVERALAGLKAAPNVSGDEMAAVQGMNAEQRTAFVQSMVDRLAMRLKQNGDDADGWLRLVRAYMVMGNRDKAEAAVSDARLAIASEADRKMFNERVRDFGFGG